jgi:hypothetical protein
MLALSPHQLTHTTYSAHENRKDEPYLRFCRAAMATNHEFVVVSVPFRLSRG